MQFEKVKMFKAYLNYKFFFPGPKCLPWLGWQEVGPQRKLKLANTPYGQMGGTKKVNLDRSAKTS
jgi:hypothetical protein